MDTNCIGLDGASTATSEPREGTASVPTILKEQADNTQNQVPEDVPMEQAASITSPLEGKTVYSIDPCHDNAIETHCVSHTLRDLKTTRNAKLFHFMSLRSLFIVLQSYFKKKFRIRCSFQIT
jgi:hypothetical protein